MTHELSGSPVLISIIIPSYRSKATIQNCLNSIVRQHFTAKEVIIIDGKSDDGTLETIRNFAASHSYARYVSEQDAGIYDAMNKGIKMAQGDWVIFLGADDELFDDGVLYNVSTFLKKASAQFVYGNAKIIGDSSWAKDGQIYDGPFSIKKLFMKNICHQAIFYKRSIFEEIGYFNLKYSVCADWELNLRCFARLEVMYINQIISKFSGGGISSNFAFDDFSKDSLTIYKNYFGISYWSSLFHRYSWTFYTNALEAFRKRKIWNGLHFLALALRHAENKMVIIRAAFGTMRKWLM